MIVGVTAARMASDECPNGTSAAATHLAGVSILAIVADGLSTAKRLGLSPGSAAILSATVVAVSETLSRSPVSCYSVVAPTLGTAALLAVALGSVLGRI